MNTNLYLRLRALLPQPPLLSGTVNAANADGTVDVSLDGGGGIVRARNPLDKPAAARVYVQDGVVIDDAPDLPYHLIEV